MRRTRDVLGDAEMNENGGLWRTRMRENPLVYRIVLEEMESMHKEQHLPGRQWLKGPAQCMTDLWKRWKRS
jgi:hypothetical protein